MTMYYSRAEMDYVEDIRTRRLIKDLASGEIDVKKGEDGVYRIVKSDEAGKPHAD